MSLTDITVGSVTYISYSSVEEADGYLAVDPTRAAAWAALTADQKGAALVSATRRLNLLNWEGAKTGAEGVQLDAWPRTGSDYDDGTPVPTDEVPPEVGWATALVAGSIVLDPDLSLAGGSGSNVKRLQAGTAVVEYFSRVTGVPLQDTTAYALVRQFLDQSSSGSSGNFASGTEEVSQFTDDAIDNGFDGGLY